MYIDLFGITACLNEAYESGPGSRWTIITYNIRWNCRSLICELVWSSEKEICSHLSVQYQIIQRFVEQLYCIRQRLEIGFGTRDRRTRVRTRLNEFIGYFILAIVIFRWKTIFRWVKIVCRYLKIQVPSMSLNRVSLQE